MRRMREENQSPLTAQEIEDWARHLRTMDVFESVANRTFSPEDGAKILMFQRRMHYPRWWRRLLDWWERL